jgi:hypothetical protein
VKPHGCSPVMSEPRVVERAVVQKARTSSQK